MGPHLGIGRAQALDDVLRAWWLGEKGGCATWCKRIRGKDSWRGAGRVEERCARGPTSAVTVILIAEFSLVCSKSGDTKIMSGTWMWRSSQEPLCLRLTFWVSIWLLRAQPICAAPPSIVRPLRSGDGPAMKPEQGMVTSQSTVSPSSGRGRAMATPLSSGSSAV